MVTTRCLIQCRVERKFLLPDHAVARFLSSLGPLLADPGFRRDQGRMTSVYLDRSDGLLRRAALSCREKNLKIRLREYFTPEGIPSSPFLWVETKERDGALSRKNRFPLHKRLVARFLRGDLDAGRILACQGSVSDSAMVEATVRRIREIADDRELVPVGAVSSRRLALEGGAPLARVTLDQDVSYHLPPFGLYDANPFLDRERLGPAALEEKASIAELKYHGSSPPSWSEKGLGRVRPAEYSKFRVLSALAVCEQRVG